MRIRTGLGVLICCCAGLTACTAAAPRGPTATVTTPAVGRPPAPASAQAALSSEAFTDAGYGQYANSTRSPHASTAAWRSRRHTGRGATSGPRWPRSPGSTLPKPVSPWARRLRR